MSQSSKPSSAHDVPRASCNPRPLARSAVGHIAACPGCGNVELTLEYLTLRLEPSAFRELVGMLCSAQRRLDAETATVGADDPIH